MVVVFRLNRALQRQASFARPVVADLPELGRAVGSGGQNVLGVGAENGVEHIALVMKRAALGLARARVPEASLAIPTSAQNSPTIGAELYRRDSVLVLHVYFFQGSGRGVPEPHSAISGA